MGTRFKGGKLHVCMPFAFSENNIIVKDEGTQTSVSGIDTCRSNNIIYFQQALYNFLHPHPVLQDVSLLSLVAVAAILVARINNYCCHYLMSKNDKL